ncbi:MAG TPA: outer membrane beta-barrel protein [Solirubrobacterales bacterium]|jgi:hypothetical protein
MTKSILKGLALAGIGALLLAAPATAQIKWHLGLGMNLPQGDLADEAIGDAGTGFGAHGGATFGLGEGPISIKADLSYETWGAGETDESFNMLGLSAAAVFGFGSGGIKPYILGTVGWNQFSVSNDDFDATSSMSFGGGAGANFMLGSIGAFVEARYLLAPFTIEGTDYDMDNIPIVFGLRF